MIDLTGKTFVIFGVKASGKSTQANNILVLYGSDAIYYDTLHEAPENSVFDIYPPDNKYSVIEYEKFIRAIVPKNAGETPKYRMVITDEANRFCPSKPIPLPPAVAELNDDCRHYGMSAGFIARRPSQLNQDLTELADYLFIYRLTGKNDIKFLNDTVTGLGEVVQNLKTHEFVLVNPDKSYEVCEPVIPDKLWIEYSKKLTKI